VIRIFCKVYFEGFTFPQKYIRKMDKNLSKEGLFLKHRIPTTL
jgi:hypothetical protein